MPVSDIVVGPLAAADVAGAESAAAGGIAAAGGVAVTAGGGVLATVDEAAVAAGLGAATCAAIVFCLLTIHN